MQLLLDPALIGKVVKDGTAKLGLTLSCKLTLLANDKSLGKLIDGHLGAEGVPTCLRRSSDRPGDRSCSGEEEMCGKPMKTHLERQTNGQESQPSVQDELGSARNSR